MFQYLVSSARDASSYPLETNSQSLIYIKFYATKASTGLHSHQRKHPRKLKYGHRSYIFNGKIILTFPGKITK